MSKTCTKTGLVTVGANATSLAFFKDDTNGKATVRSMWVADVNGSLTNILNTGLYLNSSGGQTIRKSSDGFLYYHVSPYSLGKIKTDGTLNSIIYSSAYEIFAFDVNDTDGYIYMAQGGNISRVSKSGTGYIPYNYLDGIPTPNADVIGANGTKIYWVNTSGPSVGFNESNIPSAYLEPLTGQLLLGTSSPDPLGYTAQFDYSNQLLYWTDGSDLIKMNFDGSGQTTLLSTGITVENIHLDIANSKIYYAGGNGSTGYLKRCNLVGGDVETIYQTSTIASSNFKYVSVCKI